MTVAHARRLTARYNNGTLSAFAALLARGRPSVRLPFALAAIAALGAARLQNAQPNFSDSAFLAHHNESGPVMLTVVVIDEPDRRDTHVNLRVRVDELTRAEDHIPLSVYGFALLRAPRHPPIRFGDRVQASGLLQAPPVFEDFDYAACLARHGVYSVVRGYDQQVELLLPTSRQHQRL
tara:strand:- start:579 stop:1115 length:537 start_codon:yes stop_codon:yes gene_type:complete